MRVIGNHEDMRPRLPGLQVHPPVVDEVPAWEYRHLMRDLTRERLPTTDELNALGEDGWELAAALSDGCGAHFYFKRERR